MVRETSHDLRAQARETILELLELVSSDEELPTGPILASDEESDNEDEVDSSRSTHDIATISDNDSNNGNNKRRLSAAGKPNVDILTNNQLITFTNTEQAELNDITPPASMTTTTDMYGLMLPTGVQTPQHQPTPSTTVSQHFLENIATFDIVAEDTHEDQDDTSNPVVDRSDNERDHDDTDHVDDTEDYTPDVIPLATKPMYKRRVVIPDSRAITSNDTQKPISIGSIYDKTGLLQRTNKWTSRALPQESSKKSDSGHLLTSKHDEALQKLDNELRTLELMEARIQSRLDIIEMEERKIKAYLMSIPYGRHLLENDQHAAMALQHRLLQDVLDSMSISLTPTTEGIASANKDASTPSLDTLMLDNNEENSHNLEKLDNLAALEALMKQAHDESVEHTIMEEQTDQVQPFTHDVDVSDGTATTLARNALSFEQQSDASP
ncbi:hypothetical protein BDF22DRAFT_477964 [Syncephalis plumigaleata]|nr:hypothetical protein BDF22DRAFT_477964 [Syncephalis plumigaleata]